MELPEFDIAVTGGLTWARLAVRGELDLSTADQLREALRQEMHNGRSVILDLGEVEFIDSTGLTVILHALKAAQENGWNLGIAASLSEGALRTVRVAGVLALLPLVEE
jgi:anti-sigma B factor antagonist